ncbi:MAG: CRISPR-associated endonuclease Cas2 [Candidatus Ancillula sp.]|jgi:CRISPR-associated endonuclease Cas2|nr:CRISPR-associated endonuclease Cas2 [Candidatus Ancillula sp.]
MKEAFFNLPITEDERKVRNYKQYVLIIYDITDTKKRNKLSKILSGFGERVQFSAFEAILTKQQFQKMQKMLNGVLEDDDKVRIYKIRGTGAVTIYGKGELVTDNETIFV